MATNTHVINLTRKPQRVGKTKLAKYGPATPAVVTINLDALTLGGRHDLQNLIASGSVLPSASATSAKLTYTAPARGRARLGVVALPSTSAVTFNPTTMTNFQRRDLIQLLASGSVLVGDSAGTKNITLYNISSKVLRFGTKNIPPKRTAGSYRATAVITLTNETESAGFKLTYNSVETIAFVQGVNCTAAAIQTALRAVTGGDVAAVVTGTTNTGPFTVTYSDGFKPLTAITVTHPSAVQVVTLTAFDGTDHFKLTYNAIENVQVFTRGSTYIAATLQSTLRTMTGDTGLLVPTDEVSDAGFTIVFASAFAPLTDVTVTTPSGVTGVTADANLSGVVAAANSVPAAIQIADSTALTAKQKLDLQWLLAAGEVLVAA